jgi:branched-chain amino acid transport system ATP-binding protein
MHLPMRDPQLNVRHLSVSYGRIQALKGVSLDVQQGEIVAVLGANGAGKSTLLKTLIGAVAPVGGSISLDGKDLLHDGPPRRFVRGMAIVPEGRQILVSLTVEENLLIGAGARRGRDETRQDLEAIYTRFPNLAARRHLEARVLSGGEQQMLAIGRALISHPRLVLLDEPSLGLSPIFVKRVYQLLSEINRQGISILVVEQNVAAVLSVATRAYVLELGEVVHSGTAKEMQASRRLKEAYLGREAKSG